MSHNDAAMDKTMKQVSLRLSSLYGSLRSIELLKRLRGCSLFDPRLNSFWRLHQSVFQAYRYIIKIKKVGLITTRLIQIYEISRPLRFKTLFKLAVYTFEYLN